jgi:hypothetical protein
MSETATGSESITYQKAKTITSNSTFSKTSSESPDSSSVTITQTDKSVRIRIVPHSPRQTGGDSRTD